MLKELCGTTSKKEDNISYKCEFSDDWPKVVDTTDRTKCTNKCGDDQYCGVLSDGGSLEMAMYVPDNKCNSEFKDDSGSEVKVRCIGNTILVGCLSFLVAVSFII